MNRTKSENQRLTGPVSKSRRQTLTSQHVSKLQVWRHLPGNDTFGSSSGEGGGSMRMEGGRVFQLMASFRNGCFSASSLTHTSIIPFLLQLQSDTYKSTIQYLLSNCDQECKDGRLLRLIPGKREQHRIAQPIVQSKTMINRRVCRPLAFIIIVIIRCCHQTMIARLS